MPLILGLFFILAAIFIEIAGFVVVGGYIGVLPTIALIMGAMLAGVILLRLQGKGVIQRIRKELAKGQVPDRHLIEGMMLIMAGILLIIPGFVSDIFGILLFLPPVRALLWWFMAKRVKSSIKFTPPASQWPKNAEGDIIIDLDDDEYQSQGNKESPWRQP